MKKSKKYDTSGLIENQFEPSSRGRVLRNRLGITSKRVMDRCEKIEQVRAIEELTAIFGVDHCFTAFDICEIHKLWLGGIYAWAGKYRNVKISKADFDFAFPEQIPKLMTELEKGPFREFTPCRFKTIAQVVRRVGCAHQLSIKQ